MASRASRKIPTLRESLRLFDAENDAMAKELREFEEQEMSEEYDFGLDMGVELLLFENVQRFNTIVAKLSPQERLRHPKLHQIVLPHKLHERLTKKKKIM